MAQIFDRSSNSLARMSFLLAGLIVIGTAVPVGIPIHPDLSRIALVLYPAAAFANHIQC